MRIFLDAVGAEQRLEIYGSATEPLVSRTAAIDYFTPDLTSAGLVVKLGGEESTTREVKPLGWEFCDLLVEGEVL